MLLSNPNYSRRAVYFTDIDIDIIKELIELLQNSRGSKVSILFKQAIDKILTTYREEFLDSYTK